MIQLLIDGITYNRFSSVSITKDIENIASGFDFSFSGYIPDDISIDADIEIRYDNETVLTGIIEHVEKSYSSEGKTRTYSGRSVSGQMIGSTIWGVSEYKNKTVGYILKDICTKFGLSFESQTKVNTKIEKFTVDPGADAVSLISDILTSRKLLAYDNSTGIVVCNSGEISESATISEENFQISTTQDITGVFSDYKVLGTNNTVSGTAKYSGLRRVRYKTIVSDVKITAATAKVMAERYKNKDVGSSETVTATGFSWKNSAGNIWNVNRVVPVNSDSNDIDKNMLTKSVNLTYDSNGESVTLTLCDKDIYS